MKLLQGAGIFATNHLGFEIGQGEAAYLQLATCQVAAAAKVGCKGILDEVELCTTQGQVPVPLITLAWTSPRGCAGPASAARAP